MTGRNAPRGYRGYQGVGPMPGHGIAEMLAAAPQSGQQQSVADLLSGQAAGLPDLAGASSSARSSRDVAELLTQQVMGRQPKGIADGLASLGEAYFARKARKKADAAEAGLETTRQDLTQRAMAGDESAIGMLLGPEAAITRKDTKDRQGIEDSRWERGFTREGDWREDDVEHRDATFSWQKGTDARDFGESKRQFDLSYGLDVRALAAKQAADAAEAAANGGMGELGLNPIYGRDEDGNRVVFQPSKSGGLVRADVPDGVTLEDDRYKEYGKTQGRHLATLERDMPKRASGLAAAEDKLTLMVDAVDLAIEQTTGWNTGLVGSMNPAAPNLTATLETLEANAAFGALQEMRNNSPTGGALGAVSNIELDLLKATVSNLRRSQSEEQLDANLKIFKEQLMGAKQRLQEAFDADYDAGLFGGMPVRRGGLDGPAASGDVTAASDDDLWSILGINR